MNLKNLEKQRDLCDRLEKLRYILYYMGIVLKYQMFDYSYKMGKCM